MKELQDTVGMMLSDDYKDRFKAEYEQLVIRRNKLMRLVERIDECSLDFQPKTPKSVSIQQWRIMGEYLTMLEARAAIEDILLPDVCCEPSNRTYVSSK